MVRQGNLWNDGAYGPGYAEAWARSRGHFPVMGVDEAGRGCLAGPVVAAAVILPDDQSINGLDDSKLMTAKARDRVFDKIGDRALAIGVGVVPSSSIDANGILPSTLEAMKAAVDSACTCHEMDVGIVIVDGTSTIPGVTLPQKSWIKGDHLSLNCAAASVIAKVTRDRLMVEMDVDYPGYGFARHKGYGTREHLDAISRLGPCPIHRMTFAPLKDLPV
ncbi:MAG: ribonuclease HII [Deltaproteobacteria bacterium]|nr:ribonuclease HII [Deltaproteobacteria bacterium]